MSLTPACFENIIGLSRTPCPCVEDLSADAVVSESGLFLDELDGLSINMLNAGVDCGQGTLWDMLARARENAMEQTQADLMACLGEETDLRRQSGSSQIGSDKKATGTGVSLPSTYHGITLQTAMMKGGTFKLTHIGACFKQTGNVTVYVYDRTSLLATYTVPAVSNQVTWYTLPVELELSMSTLGQTPPQYWIVFRPDEFTGVQPLKAMGTRFDCGCGGGTYSPTWSLARPQYLSANSKAGNLWAEWSQATGTYGTDLADREDWSGTTGINETQGLLLQVAYDCDQRTTFCADAPNYRTDNIQKAIAHAVRFKAAANLVTAMLSSTAINRYTMTAGEIMAENRRRWESQYNKHILEYICPTLALPQNVNRYGDCLKCKDHYGMRVGRIGG